MPEKTPDLNLPLPAFDNAFDLGRMHQQTLGEVHRVSPDSKPFVIVESNKTHVLDMEQYDDRPSKINSTVSTSDAESFIRYVNDFKDDGSRIFALFGDTGGKFRAVLDYHRNQENPRWGAHVVIYSCPTTPEWDEWVKNSGKMMSQSDFSEFVENQRLAFQTPAVATMLEIARTLEASTTGKFESHINPTNGNRTLIYKDEVNASAGGTSKTPIPAEITVLLQPFRRGSVYQVQARLIYRIREGKVTFQYDLIRAHEIIEVALKEITALIVEKTEIVPYNSSL